ncbi:hypothetical protein ACJX0J_039496, partial [Zea mays]
METFYMYLQVKCEKLYNLCTKKVNQLNIGLVAIMHMFAELEIHTELASGLHHYKKHAYISKNNKISFFPILFTGNNLWEFFWILNIRYGLYYIRIT